MTLRMATLVLLASLLLAGPVAAQPSAVGQWTTLPTLPFFPVHVMLLPSGQVMMWPGDEGISGDNALLWNPATAGTTPLAHVGYDLFCSGHSHLADGRIFVTGGHIQNFVGLPRAAIYDPLSNAWTPLPDMNAGRWYPTNTTLPNGDVLVVSGDVDMTVGVNTLPQVFEMARGAWRDLTDAQLGLELYPYMHVAPNGLIFNSGPSLTTRYLDTSGTGAWTTVANRNDGFRDYGGSVMYAPGKILTVGGDDPPRATAEVIDLNAPNPAWRSISSMAIARRQMNSTILPDGRILVTGGTNGPGFNNLDTPVFPAEMWDPTTETWTTLASASVPRLYHSAALLLPDGRVLNTGGNGHPEVQVFEPPYLFKGARPTITAAPGSVSYGQTALVQTSDAVARVTLIRIGAVTHTNNMDQRFNELPFTPAGSGVSVTFPSGPTLAPPGHYMLFVLNSQGVPSVGSIVLLGGAASNAPAVRALTPSQTSANGPDFTLTVDGSGFVSGSVVQWNGSARSTTFVSNTRLTASITNADIASAGTATVRVVNPDTQTSNAATFTIGGGCPAGQFLAEYFANRTLTAPPARTACESSINYNWGSGGPAGLPTDNFSVRWTGSFSFPAGATTFTATADDGIRVFVDGTTVIDAWRDQAATTYTGTRSLTAGQHDVKVEYYEASILAVAQVSWSSAGQANPTLTALSPNSAAPGGPGFTLTATGSNFVAGSVVTWNGASRPTTFVSATQLTASIPASDIASAGQASVAVRNDAAASNTLTFVIGSGGASCPNGQFFAVYFANVTLSGTAVRTACEPTINYNWGGGGPAGLPTDNFSVRWTGRFTFPAGNTTFSATADDGVRLYVDGALAIDAWIDQPATTYTATRTLTAGDHDVKVEYYERGGLAVAQVSWNSAAPTGPTLATLAPATATAGGPAFTLTADGSNFVSGATLLWNGAARSTTFVSSTRVTASIAAADIAAAASVPVTVRNPNGVVSNAQTFTVTSSVATCPTGQFFAEYFNNVALSGTAVRTACEPTINYNWGGGGPAGLPTDNFSVRWTGRFMFAAGDTTFSATADDGVRLYVDGTLVIDAWVDQAATTYTATRTLTAGEHEVKVEYYERGGLAVAQASWNSAAPTGPSLATLTPASATAGGPGFVLTADGSNFVSGATLLWNGAARPTTFVSSSRMTATITAADIAAPASVSVTVENPSGVISNAQTFTVTSSVAGCPTGQFFAEYFNNVSLSGSPVQTACESSVYYNWGSGGPAGLPVDNFSVRWTGRFQFSGGNTTFTVAADDGVRLYVDGVLVIDAWIDQGATTRTATRTLTAGQHEVRVEYYEHTGDAVIQVLF